MDPADLTVKQILAVFEAMRTIRDMAVKGLSAGDAAKAMYWRVEDIRTAAALMGFSLSEHVTRQEVCPVCGHLLMPDRHCDICALRTRLARLHAVNAAEHQREVERLENAIDAIKQDTCRTRERLGTNPRKSRQEETA